MTFSQPTFGELAGAAFAVALLLVIGQALAAAPPESPTLPTPQITPADAGPDQRGAGGGVLPDGVTVFDERQAGITHLQAGLLDALRAASAESGIDFVVSSGWRSTAYQRQLFEQAISQYGSADAAAAWVARPGTSIHEQGGAVDVSEAASRWLARHGSAYGLCPVYANEPWHYEFRAQARGEGCPPLYADAAHDPRSAR